MLRPIELGLVGGDTRVACLSKDLFLFDKIRYIWHSLGKGSLWCICRNEFEQYACDLLPLLLCDIAAQRLRGLMYMIRIDP